MRKPPTALSAAQRVHIARLLQMDDAPTIVEIARQFACHRVTVDRISRALRGQGIKETPYGCISRL